MSPLVHSEDIASEPYIARGDDASRKLPHEKIKRKFVLQKLVAVQTIEGLMVL